MGGDETKVRVKYAGIEATNETNELIVIHGKPGQDFVEIYGTDRDGYAAVGVSPRKLSK